MLHVDRRSHVDPKEEAFVLEAAAGAEAGATPASRVRTAAPRRAPFGAAGAAAEAPRSANLRNRATRSSGSILETGKPHPRRAEAAEETRFAARMEAPVQKWPAHSAAAQAAGRGLQWVRWGSRVSV